MDIRKLQRAIVDGLEDVKGQDIVVFNTEHLSPLFERVVVVSGQSNRQTKALAASVRDAVKSAGLPVLRTEGEENGEWIIVDCGAAVVHVMQPSIRDYYRLEEIWGGKPVNVKLSARKTGLVKASEGPDEDEPAARPAKPAKKDAPARKAVAAKTPVGVKTGPAKGTSTRAPAAKKAAPAKAASAKKAPAKSAAGRTAAAKTAAGKTPAGKTVAGKAPAGRTAAGKSTTTRGTSPRSPSGGRRCAVACAAIGWGSPATRRSTTRC